MFTGITTDIGLLLDIAGTDALRLRIATRYDAQSIEIGASIACDGICLTVIATGQNPQNWFEAEISAETRSRTTIGRQGWQSGRRLNLERALRIGDELGGHIVSGHVDGTAEVISRRVEGDSLRVGLRAPKELARFIAPKGSIALNGTSLTVNEVGSCDFGINLIPHTRKVTTWDEIAEGDFVNLEIDTLARYVARLQEWG